MRIEAEVGPVVLVMERDKQPKPGERFKVAVFVSDKALGIATVAYEAWTTFCQAAQTSGALRVGPCSDYQPDPDSETTRCKRCGAPWGNHR